jgi:hypothetical protein
MTAKADHGEKGGRGDGGYCKRQAFHRSLPGNK